jgi:kynureninase
MNFQPGREFAEHLDRHDPLASFRNEFVIAEPDLVYMDGNSLGRLPRRAVEQVQATTQHEWGQRLIRSWNENWYHAPSRVGDKLAHLVGAAPGQVVVSDSTSVNLFKLVMAALDARPGRDNIISDAFNFPSDLYILQGCIRLLGNRHNLHLAASSDRITIDEPALHDAIDERTALVTLSHVTFKSGYLYDVAAVTKRAHQAGALVLWDLSHSVGAVPIELDKWNADLAVGCTYKYLNGGPGAPAFLYVRRDLQDKLASPIWGWFGERRPFAFDLDYTPAEGVARFQSGTPPILSLLAMESALEITFEAGIERIREKSIQQTTYLIYLFDQMLAPLGFTLGSPRAVERRGSHVSLRHPEAYRINQALIQDKQVLPDFREPDNIRLGLAPLYTAFAEIWETVQRIQQVVMDKSYMRYATTRPSVT